MILSLFILLKEFSIVRAVGIIEISHHFRRLLMTLIDVKDAYFIKS